MDLALAKFVETQLPGAGKLDAAQYGMLTQACRQAKETLLGPKPPASHTVTVMGRGRQVIGGTLHADADADRRARSVIFDGFFPIVPRDAEPQRGARTGLHEMGLPYVSDPAITRHLADFLQQHARPGDEQTGRRRTAILFNGGVFTAGGAARSRWSRSCTHWFDRPGASLAAAGADQSVARPGRGLGGRLFRLAQAHRRPAHRRRHCSLLLRRRSRPATPSRGDSGDGR